MKPTVKGFSATAAALALGVPTGVSRPLSLLHPAPATARLVATRRRIAARRLGTEGRGMSEGVLFISGMSAPEHFGHVAAEWPMLTRAQSRLRGRRAPYSLAQPTALGRAA